MSALRYRPQSRCLKGLREGLRIGLLFEEAYGRGFPLQMHVMVPGRLLDHPPSTLSARAGRQREANAR